MRRLFLSALCVCVGACHSIDEYAKAWEEIHRPVLLEGYHDFRGHVDGTDDGYIVFSYKLPDGVAVDAAIPKVKQYITTKYPCYQVLEQSRSALVLRCPGGRLRGSFYWDEEYRVLLDEEHGRVFMLVIDSIKRPRYQQIVGMLETAYRATR